MASVVNHYQVRPEVYLTPQIQAAQLVKCTPEGRLSAHKVWMPPGVEYPPHTHPSPHIIVVLEGHGYVRCGQTEQEWHSITNVKVGDVFNIPENVPHQVGAHFRGMVMLVVGLDEKPLDDPARMIFLPESPAEKK